MTLAAGTRLGPFEIVRPIGKGGMGEVYRAHDTKLGRDVAIKVLPDALAHDADRLQRFEREARTLAALNHPNIAHIYGLETVPPAGTGPGATTHALVMELVEGPTLEQVIREGPGLEARAAPAVPGSEDPGLRSESPKPMPAPEALAIARQIADGLEAAHEQGIVHRDLKPANVKVRDDGTVKILDFGLAKALNPGASGPELPFDAMNSPTLTVPGTAIGMILGTAAYMAPEQAKGRPVDRRADVWAFGVVLYEMLTGRRAFKGDDVSEILASVIKSDPDWNDLPAATPASIRRVLRRCLEKDPRKRLRSIGDARLDLDETEPEPIAPGEAPATIPVARPSLIARLWPAAAAVLVTAAIGLWLWPPAPAPAHVSRLSIVPPAGVHMYPDSVNMAISPDGRMVAFVEGDPAQRGQGQLWLRSLDTLEAHAVEGADLALLPFWSPDSRRIGFFTIDKLVTMPVDGGRQQALCDAPNGRGATWNADNTIVFAPDANGPLFRVSANGGQPEAVTSLDTSRGESGHRSPMFLPDGQHFLYAVLPGHAGKFDILVGSLADSSRTLVGQMESAPTYAAGRLLFTREGVLAAQPFDLHTLKLTGEAVSLDDAPTTVIDPSMSDTAGRLVSVSSDGTLAYFSAPPAGTSATWLDLTGSATGTLSLPPAQYLNVAIAPDGTRAVFVRATSPSESTLWLTDLSRGGAVPLSTGPGLNTSPVWAPDSTRVVFASDRDGPQNFYVKTMGDASPETLVYRSSLLFKNPTSWSPDGQWILFTRTSASSPGDVYVLPASGGATPQPYVAGPRAHVGGVSSPDGHWVAYESDDTGRAELYVQSFPTPGRAVQVSIQGAGGASGGAPVPYWWTPDGRHLLFVGIEQRSLWRADLTPGPSLKVAGVARLAALPPGLVSIDMTPDRNRFLALLPEQAGERSITIVQHWDGSLGKGQ